MKFYIFTNDNPVEIELTNLSLTLEDIQGMGVKCLRIEHEPIIEPQEENDHDPQRA